VKLKHSLPFYGILLFDKDGERKLCTLAMDRINCNFFPMFLNYYLTESNLVTIPWIHPWIFEKSSASRSQAPGLIRGIDLKF